MQTQRTELNFEGQNLFVGIDVHLKSWTVSILSEKLSHKTFTQPANAEALHNYLVRSFPGGVYHSFWATTRVAPTDKPFSVCFTMSSPNID